MGQDAKFENTQQRQIENAVIRLIKSKPFYGHFLMNFRREINSSIYAVGVTIRNGTPVINFNPVNFIACSESEQQALLEHGLKHILHLHPARRKSRHHLTWDVATDLAINPAIENLPDTALMPQRSHGL